MLVDTENRAVSSDGGTKTISVTSNANWTVSSDSTDWLTVSQNSTYENAFVVNITDEIVEANQNYGTGSMNTYSLQNNYPVFEYFPVEEFDLDPER